MRLFTLAESSFIAVAYVSERRLVTFDWQGSWSFTRLWDLDNPEPVTTFTWQQSPITEFMVACRRLSRDSELFFLLGVPFSMVAFVRTGCARMVSGRVEETRCLTSPRLLSVTGITYDCWLEPNCVRCCAAGLMIPTWCSRHSWRRIVMLNNSWGRPAESWRDG
jgi:hypothetical protein